MDIYCIKCGEPWDAWGARNGDMAPWEYNLFRKGAGCPCCQGEDNGFMPERLEHVEFGDEDPAIRINQMEDKLDGLLPKWERPENPVFWTCEGCGVQVIGNLDYPKDSDDYLEYHLPSNAPGHKWYNSHPYHRGTPEKEPAHVFKHEERHWIWVESERSKGAIQSYEAIEIGQPVCEFCLSHCHECGEPVCSLLEHSDCYDPGWCSTVEGYGYEDVFCIGCVESMCSDCNRMPDECECIWCQECGNHLAECEDDLPEACPSCGAACKQEDDEDEDDDAEDC